MTESVKRAHSTFPISPPPKGRKAPSLHQFCREGSLLAVSHSLSSGVPINALDRIKWTPLDHAKYNNWRALCRFLPKKGAFHGDRYSGPIDLLKACMNGRVSQVAFMIDKLGYSANMMIPGGKFASFVPAHSYLLHQAAKQGRLKVVGTLILRGARPELLDSKGRTAQEVAIHYKKPMVAEYIDKVVLAIQFAHWLEMLNG